jgi:hypothetical protein
MFLLKFALRRFLRHWRLNLVVFLGLCLTSGLLAGLPSYAMITAARSLNQSLVEAPPPERNIQITGPGFSLTAGLLGYIKDNLGDLMLSRMEVNNIGLMMANKDWIIPIDDSPRVQPQQLTLWSFDKLSQYAWLVDGEWPINIEPKTQREALAPPVLQAVIAKTTVEQTGLKIGDEVFDNQRDRFIITGIIERGDPTNDVWWGDESPFKLGVQPGLNEDTLILPLLVTPHSLTQYFSKQNVRWRLVLDHQKISAENAQEVEEGLLNLKTRIEAERAEMQTGVINLLLQYRSDLSTARTAIFLLSAQSIIFILYTLGLIASLILDRSQNEIAALVGRGTSSIRITLSLAVEGLPLALIAGVLVGPLLAYAGLLVWVRLSGDILPVSITTEAELLSLAGAAFGWLAIVIPIYPAARHNLLDWQQHQARPEVATIWQKLNLDLFLLVLGVILYWQLSSSGSLLLRRLEGLNLADPILLLGPSILLIAAASLFLRFFPYLLRALAWLAHSVRGLLLPMGLTRLARDPVRPSRIILLISLAAALTLFAKSFSDSMSQTQWEIAHYQAGADLRLRMDENVLQDLENVPGISVSSKVLRGVMQRSDGRGINFIALDTTTFPFVTRYPPGMTNLTIEGITKAVQWEKPTNTDLQFPDNQPQEEFGVNPYDQEVNNETSIPAVFSRSALPSGMKIGDNLSLKLNGSPVTLEVRGIILDFPTMLGAYVVVDQAGLNSQTRLDSPLLMPNWEVWLNLDTDEYSRIIQTPSISENILADATNDQGVLARDALSRGAINAFQLNAIILAVLSIAGFFLISFFTAQKRSYEFSVLRATGVSAMQLLKLTAGEGFLIMVMGLCSGIALGYVLALMMQPFLGQALAANLPGIALQRVWLNWPSIAWLYIILILFYALTVGLLLLALLQVGVHRTLRIGEE